MPTMGETPVPEDIEWKDITNDQVAFLKRNFSQEALNEGLIVSFKETSQLNGLTILVIHFERQGGGSAATAVAPAARHDDVPASPAVGRRRASSPGERRSRRRSGTRSRPSLPHWGQTRISLWPLWLLRRGVASARLNATRPAAGRSG